VLETVHLYVCAVCNSVANTLQILMPFGRGIGVASITNAEQWTCQSLCDKNSIFSSAAWAIHISWSKCCLCVHVCVCLCACLYVNQGGTNVTAASSDS